LYSQEEYIQEEILEYRIFFAVHPGNAQVPGKSSASATGKRAAH